MTDLSTIKKGSVVLVTRKNTFVFLEVTEVTPIKDTVLDITNGVHTTKEVILSYTYKGRTSLDSKGVTFSSKEIVQVLNAANFNITLKKKTSMDVNIAEEVKKEEVASTSE